MNDYERIIAEKDKIIAEKDKEIAELEEKINKLQNQLDGIVKLIKGKKTKVFLSCFPRNKANRYVSTDLNPML